VSVAALALFALLGCVEDTPSALLVTRDSAGITIIESLAPSWGSGEGWRVNPDPILDLAESGTGLAHEFSSVPDAVRLPDGGIAVLDAFTREIRFFSAAGEHLWTVGRDGEGPGEFQGLQSIDRYGADSVLVFDQNLRRGTVFGPPGHVPRVIQPATSEYVRGLFPLDDGGFIAQILWPGIEVYRGEIGLFFRGHVPILLLSADGVVSDTVAMVAGIEWFMDARGEAGHLFQKYSHVGVHEGMVYVGDASQLEYQVLDPLGGVERIVRVPGLDLRISEEDLEREMAVFVGRERSQEDVEWFYRQRRGETKPAYSTLLIDAEGYVWLEEYRNRWAALRSELASDWNVFSPQGVWLGSVHLPARFEVFEIGRDFVLGQRYDDLDVSHPQILQLDRH
jgi:hypothetical protein